MTATPEPRDSGDAAARALDYLGGMWSWNDAYLDDPAHGHLWVVLAGRILREMVGRPARDPDGVRAAAPAEAREEGPG